MENAGKMCWLHVLDFRSPFYTLYNAFLFFDYGVHGKYSNYTIICTHTINETVASCLSPLLSGLTFTIAGHQEHLPHCSSAYEGDLIGVGGIC